MDCFPYIFVIVVVLFLLCVYFYNPKLNRCPGSEAKKEAMIAANTIARMTRGYNALNTDGVYAPALTKLSEAETMHLIDVDTGMRPVRI